MNENNTQIAESTKSLAQPFLEGKKDFLTLKFNESKDRKVALYCLGQKKSFLDKLNKTEPQHLALLTAWVMEDFSNYIHIYKKNLSTPALLELYLYSKFKNTNPENSGIVLLRSLKKRPLICYRYKTKKGETISYMDSALNVPTLLTVTADVKFKVVDPERLIEYVDYDITIIDLSTTVDRINGIVNKVIRDTLLKCIVDNKLNYYELPQHYSELNEQLADNLEVDLSEMGVEPVSVSILDISIPNNTSELFEKQNFAIAEAERAKKYEYRIEGLALDLYEKKAEIHSKYPEFPVSLTEAEKDFALNRYLNRNGIDTTLSTEIAKKKLEAQREQGSGTVTNAKDNKPIKPVKPNISNSFKKGFFGLFFLLLVASCLVCIGSVPGGLIAIGVTVFIFGAIAVVKLPDLKTNPANHPEMQKYYKALEEYERDMEAWQANRNDAKMLN